MRKLWLFCILIIVSEALKAQNPVVNFTATPLTGCAPLVVNFTDQSTGNPTNWDWDLGNGQLSNTRNPVVVYNIPGVYTVKLVVRNADGIAQLVKTNYITVSATPVAAFTSSATTGCAPNSITFTDNSVAAGGTITSWLWTFGDGGTSTAQNPTYTYSTPGFYDVTLQVTSNQGCKVSTIRQRYIRIVPGVTANFNPVPANTCTAPFTVSYTNESVGPGNLSYLWDLGNKGFSNVAAPTTIYNDTGNYRVTLITISDYGCSDTIEKVIPLKANLTKFSAPDTACLNVAVNFTNISSPAPVSSRWDFGDGGVSNSRSPSYTYDSAGTYTVKLVNRYLNCTDSVTKTIVIGPKPLVDFSSVNHASCKAPFTVEFLDRTQNSTAWFWDFGDGTNSTEQNPKHTFNQLGQYDITLTATFGGGCQNSITKPVFVQVVEPTIGVSNLPSGGCIPYTFSPVHTVNAVDGVASWLWDFGDGSTSTQSNPSHIYTTAGSFDIKLRIVTNSGCVKDTTFVDGVKTGSPVIPDFVADKFEVCASEAVQFTDLTNGADEWLWDFGDGTVSIERNPSHVFADTGFVTVTLTAFRNRCGTSVIKTNYIHTTPPIARFAYTVDCSNKLLVNFRDSSIIDPTLGNISYSWTFGTGPGAGSSTAINPSFTFSSFGSHPVTLTVTNGPNCSFTYVGSILLTNEKAAFTSTKTTVCKDEQFTLTATPVNADNIKFYEWTVGNNTPVMDTLPTFKYKLSDSGSYNVRLVIIDSNSCRDTLVQSNYIRVVGPEPDFGPDAKGTCPNTLISFTDKTVSAAPIVKWTWEYGDGTVQDYTAPPFNHSYKNVGVYSVKLTVTDNGGCKDSKTIRDTVIITSPKAGFVADTIYCPAVNLSFNDTSSGRNLSYFWNFGNGNTSTLQNPTQSYASGDAAYTISLKITDEFGCSDSVTKSSYVKIRSPKAAFTSIDTTSLCPPLETRFTLEAKDYESYYWDFGDGTSQSTVPNPRHFYNGYNVYTPMLVAVGYGGCADTAIHHVTLSDPNSTRLNYTPLEACNTLTATFDLKPPPYSRYVFYYGDGLANTSQDTAFSHFYRGPAYFYPSVFLTDSSGCQFSLTNYQPIRVIGAKPLFGPDKNQSCDTANVAFTNFTIFNDPVVSYNWTFGDGATSSDFSPTHFYTQPGVNLVTLKVVTQQGCTDSLTDTIHVHRTPVASIIIPDTVCINTPLLFKGQLAVADTAAIKWQWTFGNGQNSTVQNPTIIYSTVGDYVVNLKTSVPFGCASDTSKRVYVPLAPTASLGNDLEIISGAGVTIPAVYTGKIIDYKWGPSQRLDCDDCPNPFANPAKTTKYKVTVRDAYGCIASDDVTIIVVCGDRNLYIPNTFSPNSDGTNDVFYPRGTGVFSIKSLRVFNRWGETVFDKTNFIANAASSGWDGTFKGQLAPQDTYIYTMEVVCENSEIIHFKGNVTLIR